MKKIQLLSLAAVAAVLLGSLPTPAQAHGGVSVGIGLGFPCWGWGYPGWYRPYPYYYPYYYPPPVVVAPAPVVQPVPVAVAATPPAPAVAATPPAPVVASTPAPANIPAPTTIFRAAAPVSESGTQYLEQLRNPDAGIRQNAVMELGKARVDQAVDPLSATLAGDSNPAVREAAARALGLIAAPRSLPALIRAAQADNDREVRHSAQFAVEVIRGNLKQQ